MDLEAEDIINLGGLSAIICFLILVISNIVIVFMAEGDKSEAFQKLIQWALPIILGIFTSFGILKMARGLNAK